MLSLDRYTALPNYHYYDIEDTDALTLEKSVEKPLRDYKIYGNSVQNYQNLFDESTATSGVYIDDTGALLENSAISMSDYIQVVEGTEYVFEVTNPQTVSHNNLRINYYDSDQVWVSQDIYSVSIGSTLSNQITIPDGVAYIRISYSAACIYSLNIYKEEISPDNPATIESCGDKTKNLVDISSLVGYKSNTMTRTTAEGNTLTLHSSSSHVYIYIAADNSQKGLFDRLKPSTTYRMKYSSRFLEGSPSNSQGRIVFVNSSATAKQTFYIGKATTIGQVVTWSGTFTTPADMSEYSQILIYGAYGDGSRTEIIEWIVTEESETVDPYEPYGYKIPIKVRGNNLVDYATVSKMAVNGTTGVASANNSRMCTDYIDVKNATNISINWGSSFAFYDKDKVFISGETKSTAIFRNYAVPADAQYIRFDWITETVGENIVYAVIGDYSASTLPPYEPYREPEIYNVYLNEPLRRTSNPYADYIDFKNSKVTRRNKKIALYYSTDVAVYNDRGSVTTYRSNGGLSLSNYSKGNPYDRPNMCNAFKYLNGAALTTATEATGEWLACAYGAVYVTIREDRLSETTNAAATEYINSLTAELIYSLDVPVEEDIELPDIKLHKGTNIITVETQIQPSNIAVQYYK